MNSLNGFLSASVTVSFAGLNPADFRATILAFLAVNEPFVPAIATR